SANGDVGQQTIFEYHQEGGRVWARYSGPGVLFGSLVAASDERGALDMHYRHFAPDGALRAGVCSSTPVELPDGRLRISERWQWTIGDGSSGESELEEIEP
ncbi:MAG: n-acetylglutamate synthase, partial [Acidobacteria bacterium]|nr:n-acetylglutamate synthase [Acidobacteriota bacterium]